MIRINLLVEREERKGRGIKLQLTLAGLSFVLLFSSFALLYWKMNGILTGLRADVNRGEKEVRVLKKRIGELSMIKVDQRVVEGKLEIIKGLEMGREDPARIFGDITRTMPKEVWIEELKSDGKIVTLKGFAVAEDFVAGFMKGLGSLPGFDSVELKILKRVKRGDVDIVSFTIRLMEKGHLKS